MKSSQFHVHVDAHLLDPEVEETLLRKHGFAQTNFCGHPVGVQDFGPRRHLTVKCQNGPEFRRRFDAVVDYLRCTRTHGYLEGEYVASDTDILPKLFDPSVRLPLHLKLNRLPAGEFRQTELHVTLSRDQSDPRLIEALCAAGFFAAYLPKTNGTAVVFTAQGYRPTIAKLLPLLTGYLAEAGGSAACSIKEERIIRWWVTDEGIELPPVVTNFDW